MLGVKYTKLGRTNYIIHVHLQFYVKNRKFCETRNNFDIISISHYNFNIAIIIQDDHNRYDKTYIFTKFLLGGTYFSIGLTTFLIEPV